MNIVSAPNNMFSSLDIQEETLMTFKTAVQVFTLSDLHVDVPANMSWVQLHCRRPAHTPPHVFTVFICAGDVSANMDCIRKAFEHLVDHYDAVCFVPGNHDCWKRNDIKHDNSVSKLQDLLALAHACDVCTGPLHICCTEQRRTLLRVCPLYSWYHSSWDAEPDLTDQASVEKEKDFPFQLKWSDFRRCLWPKTAVKGFDFITTPDTTDGPAPDLCSMFAELNDPFISRTLAARETQLQRDRQSESDEIASHSAPESPLITFSHFLPRQECCPEKRFLTEQHLMKVVGSTILDTQIRALRPDLHIFGHTHIPIDLTVDGQRYLQWPLGYAREAGQACAPVRRLCSPLLVYESGVIPRGGECSPAIHGVPTDVPSYDAFWSGYYRAQARMPASVDPIPSEMVESLKAVSLEASERTPLCSCCVDSDK